MTDVELRAAIETYIASADELQLASLIDALEAAFVGRVHPRVTALVRASIHGIRINLASSRRYAAAEKEAARGID